MVTTAKTSCFFNPCCLFRFSPSRPMCRTHPATPPLPLSRLPSLAAPNARRLSGISSCPLCLGGGGWRREHRQCGGRRKGRETWQKERRDRRRRGYDVTVAFELWILLQNVWHMINVTLYIHVIKLFPLFPGPLTNGKFSGAQPQRGAHEDQQQSTILTTIYTETKYLGPHEKFDIWSELLFQTPLNLGVVSKLEVLCKTSAFVLFWQPVKWVCNIRRYVGAVNAWDADISVDT